MRYKAGDVFPQLTVTTSKGAPLTIPVAGANYTHLQFRRFSGCPICNTHIAELRRNIAQLEAAGIHEVLFFHSSQEDVAAFHNDLPFDAVGDREKHYYSQFGVESSWKAISAAAVRAALASILRGNFGLKITGGPLGLPAEFLHLSASSCTVRRSLSACSTRSAGHGSGTHRGQTMSRLRVILDCSGGR